MADQLVLWGAELSRGDHERHSAEFLAVHQLGQIRLPWDTAAGDKAGDLIPAWRCCRCGAIELSWFLLERSHGCEDRPDACSGYCDYHPVDRTGPYAMDAHWIPPT